MTAEQQKLIDDNYLEWKTLNGKTQAVSLVFESKEKMFDFLDEYASTESEKVAIEFANWINNNWWIPTGNDFYWMQDRTNSEYQVTIKEIDLDTFYTTKQLLELFNNKQGEF